VLSVYENPQSRYFIVLSCFCSAMIFTFLSHAPEFYIRVLGASEGLFSVLFAVSSIGIIAGQWLNHRLIANLGSEVTAFRASISLFIVATGIFFLSVIGAINLLLFSILMLVFNTFYLVVFANFLSLCMDPHAARAGTASAIYGFSSYIGGALLSVVVGLLADGGIVRWAMCFSVLALVIMLGARHWSTRVSQN